VGNSSLVRLGGITAVLSGVLLIIGDLSYFFIDDEDFARVAASGAYIVQAVLFLLAGMLLLVGLVGIHLRQSEAAGVLGLVGFLAALLGTALVMGAFWTDLFVTPTLAQEVPELLNAEEPPAQIDLGFILTFSLFALGWLLFGISVLRARIYPRAAAVLLIISAALTLIPLPATGIIFSAAVIWLGFLTLTMGAPAAQSPRVA
jgi:uncharacterized membrane protein (DUF485 family)